MKKAAAPRIAALSLLYFVIFTALVVLQFSSRRTYSRRVGPLTVTWNYRRDRGSPLPEYPAAGGTYPLNGTALVSLGGMSFRLDPAGGFCLLGPEGAPAQTAPEFSSPEFFTIEGNAVSFQFPAMTDADIPDREGTPVRTRLIFGCQTGPAGPELRIHGEFGNGVQGAEIPYRPLSGARVRDGGQGGFLLAADGMTFSFGRSRLDTERRLAVLENGAFISWRAQGDEKAFRPENYSLPDALDRGAWDARIARWRDEVFASWGRTPTASLTDEELIIAYAVEAIGRGSFREVIARVPRSFLDSSRRGYRSSVFLGSMNQALRSYTASGRERTARLQALLRQNPLAYINEIHVFAENRRQGFPQDEGLGALAALDPERLPPELVPAILEHRADWQDLLDSGGGGENPFEPFVSPALEAVTARISMDPGGQWVFYFPGDRAGTESNFRLGMALDRYGRQTGEEGWAALGRSIVLSVMLFTDPAGTVPQSIDRAGLSGDAGGERFSAARFYPWLELPNWPRLLEIAGITAPNAVWTAANAVSGAWEGDIFDLAVTFPAGETHYLMIRRVRPFTSIQLHGINYRTDLQFERYDSSGWIYSAAEQYLLVKLRQRAPVEHIRINYTPPPPAPPPRPVERPPAEEAAGPEAPSA